MNFNARLGQTIKERDSLVCVGLDVIPERMPQHLMRRPDPIFEFNRAIIKATSDLAAAYKPNLAFYEALGAEGWDILKRTVQAVPPEIVIVGDAKRGDIGSTAERYAAALFDIGFDAVTLSPYLGRDSIDPFIQLEEQGVFILCLTSNPSSRDFQKLKINGRPLYQHVAEMIVLWNEKGNCGLVAGATHPDELKAIREIAPDLPFLIPGIGAQGGDLEGAILQGTDGKGNAALINSSRGILYASSGENFAEAARRECMKLREAVNTIRNQKRASS